MEKEKLRQILHDQQEIFNHLGEFIEREVSLNLDNYIKGNEIIIITGIRRCGKSSLLKLNSKKLKERFVYINFDDVRFTDFKVQNFEDIEEIVFEMQGAKKGINYLLKTTTLPPLGLSSALFSGSG